MIRTLVALGFLSLIWTLAGCEGVEELINANRPPELDERGIIVSADRVAPFDTVTASISATNPVEGPLFYEWSATGGRFIQPADSSLVFWIAPLQGGLYQLTVKVSNNRKSVDASKAIEVVSSAKPLVDIREPSEDAYFVVSQPIPVEAHAQHENGLSRVRLLVSKDGQDSLIQQLDGNAAGIYRFDRLRACRAWVGKATLIVEAQAANQLQTIGNDSVIINIEGIIEGKNEP